MNASEEEECDEIEDMVIETRRLRAERITLQERLAARRESVEAETGHAEAELSPAL